MLRMGYEKLIYITLLYSFYLHRELKLISEMGLENQNPSNSSFITFYLYNMYNMCSFVSPGKLNHVLDVAFYKWIKLHFFRTNVNIWSTLVYISL